MQFVKSFEERQAIALERIADCLEQLCQEKRNQ